MKYFLTYLVKLNDVRVTNFFENLDLSRNPFDVFFILDASLF